MSGDVEKMREEFEASYCKRWGILSDEKTFERARFYALLEVESEWSSWQAATLAERANTEAARGQRDALEKLLGEAAEVLATIYDEEGDEESARLLEELGEKILTARRAVQLDQREGK